MLNVLVGGTFVSFSFLLGGRLSIFSFLLGDVCIFIGIISFLDLDHAYSCWGDICLYSWDDFKAVNLIQKLKVKKT